MAHTQTHTDIQTDRISKKSTIKRSKSHKNADGLTHRTSFTTMLTPDIQKGFSVIVNHRVKRG